MPRMCFIASVEGDHVKFCWEFWCGVWKPEWWDNLVVEESLTVSLAIWHSIQVWQMNRWHYMYHTCISATLYHTHTHPHTHTQPFYGPLSGTTRVSRYQKKHSPTHHRHHPIFISFFHLPRSIASSLFKLRAWQSFCTTSFHVLWSTSWSGALHLIFHTFLHPISVFFSQHMPIPSQPVLL